MLPGDDGLTILKKLREDIVLYESSADISEMNNHLDRPEIKAAIKSGSGSDTRLSDTLGVEDYYYALLLKDEYIL